MSTASQIESLGAGAAEVGVVGTTAYEGYILAKAALLHETITASMIFPGALAIGGFYLAKKYLEHRSQID
jgi:hypothetical protein